ncbi:4-hydroxy-2-oxovalerate aldolase [Sphingosinicella microcystinivorans]|uniref:2-keto-3-deoxy-L-rhamnonate aldolase RhmA n=2 Tax=Sphingosinicella microcystinivorans TaxID=335406 RepID=A0AAD1FZX5_SPHMI|nr:aldolase/citrate lyase family protein [Sphingosinicella microcystinivorans]RKS85413.1 2-keto-3-deoxy-L-rhamnonate aldolase RhmA [Sphingosinicella microcystinivorans]BBE33297.1 4-hydroxy-2-oxovalerate aldolase [Sphingosinicella microcystinivorans]
MTGLPSPLEIAAAFRDRVRARDRLTGTFVKTPSPHIVEIIGHTGVDFIVLDGEHAPFDRTALDTCLMAAMSVGLPALVRMPGGDRPLIGAALDLGAAAIVAPHVPDADQARAIVRAARFAEGDRGVSPSTRAGRYGGMGAADYIAASDAATGIWAQIEDPDAVAALDDIAAVAGIDCLFVGRVDLAHALGAAHVNDPAVDRAVAAAIRAADTAGLPTAIFAASVEEARAWRERGAAVIVLATDQAMLRTALSRDVATLRAPG